MLERELLELAAREVGLPEVEHRCSCLLRASCPPPPCTIPSTSPRETAPAPDRFPPLTLAPGRPGGGSRDGGKDVGILADLAGVACPRCRADGSPGCGRTRRAGRHAPRPRARLGQRSGPSGMTPVDTMGCRSFSSPTIADKRLRPPRARWRRSGAATRCCRPAGAPSPLPAGATLCMLPGRRPVGIDPATGALVVLHEVKVGRRRIRAARRRGHLAARVHADLPARRGPAALADDRRGADPAAVGVHRGGARSARAGRVGAPHRPARPLEPRAPLDARPAGARRAHWSRTGNPIYRQLARCALEWRCFTAQNTFYGRDEGAIPSSSSCNAACVGCLSEQQEGLPPSSPRADRARRRARRRWPRSAVRHLATRHRARHGELRPGLRGRAAHALEGD